MFQPAMFFYQSRYSFGKTNPAQMTPFPKALIPTEIIPPNIQDSTTWQK